MFEKENPTEDRGNNGRRIYAMYHYYVPTLLHTPFVVIFVYVNSKMDATGENSILENR